MPEDFMEMIKPYFQKLKKNGETLKFEIQNLSDVPTLYMEDDPDAPVVFRVQDESGLLNLLKIVVLINFMSDCEISVFGSTWWIERSSKMDEHFEKLFIDESGSLVKVDEDTSVKVTGFYVTPKTVSSIESPFRMILINGKWSDQTWINEIVYQFFTDITYKYFSYVLDISCEDPEMNKPEIEVAVIKCCREMVKKIIFDLKILSVDLLKESGDVLLDRLFTTKTIQEQEKDKNNVSLIDLDDIYDDNDFEIQNIMSKSEVLWDRCSSLTLPEEQNSFFERLLTGLWMSQKWINVNNVDLLARPEYNLDEDQTILDYIPKTGLAKIFWEKQNQKIVKSPIRKSERLARTKSSKFKSLFDCLKVKEPIIRKSPVFQPKSPKKFYGSPLRAYFSPKPSTSKPSIPDFESDLETIWNDKIISDSTNIDIETSPMDHDSILISDDENSDQQRKSSQERKFFLDPELKKKRINVKSNTLSKKPDFVPRRKKNPVSLLREQIASINKETPKIDNFFMPMTTNKTKAKIFAEDMDMNIEINKPKIIADAKREEIKRLANQLHPERERVVIEKNQHSRGSKMVQMALNSRKSPELSAFSVFGQNMEVQEVSDEESLGAERTKISYFNGNSRAKPEINFDLMDYD